MSAAHEQARIQDWLTAATLGIHPGEPQDPLSVFQRRIGSGDSDSDDNLELIEEEEDSTEEDVPVLTEEKSKYPAWFLPRAFQYNGRMLAVSLPGFILVLNLGGDLLLSVMTLGALVVYLFHVAGENRKALIAYMLTFVCCHMTVMYSSFPIIWTSLLNIFFLMAINMFTVLTGGLAMLQFEDFRCKEAELVKTVEVLLFALYPSCSVVLVTWVVSSAVSSVLAPYCLMLLGFVVLQLFLAPTPSSFFKVGQRPRGGVIYPEVLEPGIIGATAIIYSFAPPGLFIVITGISRFTDFFVLSTWFELGFIVMLSIFLSTLMNLREFLDLAEISVQFVIRTRWVCGNLALVLLSSVLQKHGFTIYLLPWLSIGVAIHAFYGLLVGRKRTKFYGLVAGTALLCLYVFMFTKLPWSLQYYMFSGQLHVSSINVQLFINAVFCVVCVYTSVYASPEMLGFLVMMQSVGLVLCEKILLNNGTYMCSMMVLSAFVAIYYSSRLHHTKRLPWQHIWLILSVHLSKLWDISLALLPNQNYSLSFLVYAQVAALALAMITSKAMLFDHETDMQFNKWLGYVQGVAMAITFNVPTLVLKLYWLMFGIKPSFPDYIGIAVLFVGLVCCKLGVSHPKAWIGAPYAGPALMAMAFLVLHLQPQPTTQWSEISKWVLIVNLMTGLMMMPVAAVLQSSVLLCVLGVVLGYPLGFTIAAWIFPADTAFSYLMLCGLILGMCAAMMLLSWRQVSNLDHKVVALFVPVMLCCGGLLLQDHWEAEEDAVPSSGDQQKTIPQGRIGFIASLILVALEFKMLSFREKLRDADLTVSGDVRIPKVALLGNSCSMLAFIVLCLSCDTDYYELWYICSSATLILLQQDGVLLRSLNYNNNIAPVLYVTSFVLWKTALEGSTFFLYRHVAHFLTGIVEMLLLALVIPVYFVFFTVLWNKKYYISEQFVIFLTPVSGFLFVFGSTYNAWIFGAYTMTVGVWMMRTRLPWKAFSQTSQPTYHQELR